jgi:TonB family protein
MPLEYNAQPSAGPPSRLHIPHDTTAVSRNRLEPKRRIEGGISFLVAGTAIAVLAFVFTLFTFPGLLGNAPPPTRVIASPPPPEDAQPPSSQANAPSRPPQLNLPPAKIPHAARPVIAVKKPSLPTAPKSVPTDQLYAQSANALAIIEQAKIEEQERLDQLRKERERAEERRREQERLAKIERQKQQARDTKEARRLAVRRKASRQAQVREQALAAARQKEQRERQRQAALAKQVASSPRVSRRTPPRYPNSARKAGAQGTTRISATITSSGQVNSARVSGSSGHSALDSSALAAVKKWRFQPAKNALGQPIAHQLVIPVTFRIQ